MDFQGYYEFTKTMKLKMIEELSKEDWVHSIQEKEGGLICNVQNISLFTIHFRLEKRNGVYHIKISNEEMVCEPLHDSVLKVIEKLDPPFFVKLGEDFIKHTSLYQKMEEIYEVFGFSFQRENSIPRDRNMFMEPLKFVTNEKDQVVEVWLEGVLYRTLQNKEEAIAFKKFISGEEVYELLDSIEEECSYICRMRTNGHRYLCTYEFPFQERIRIQMSYQINVEDGFYYQFDIRVGDAAFWNRINVKELNEETKRRIKTEIKHIYENLKCKKEILEVFVKTTPQSFLLDHKTFWLGFDEVSGFDLNIYTHTSKNGDILHQADVWLCFGKGNVTINSKNKEELKQKVIDQLRKSIAAKRLEVLMSAKNEGRKWGKICAYMGKGNMESLSWVYEGIRTEEEAKEELLQHFKDKWLLARRYERPIETEHFIFEENGSNTIKIKDKKIVI